jgi:hypothetical protein
VSAAAAISTIAIPSSLRKRRGTRAKRRDSDTREQNFHRQLSHDISPLMQACALSAPKSRVPLQADWLRSGESQAAASEQNRHLLCPDARHVGWSWGGTENDGVTLNSSA